MQTLKQRNTDFVLPCKTLLMQVDGPWVSYNMIVVTMWKSTHHIVHMVMMYCVSGVSIHCITVYCNAVSVILYSIMLMWFTGIFAMWYLATHAWICVLFHPLDINKQLIRELGNSLVECPLALVSLIYTNVHIQ